MGSTPPSARGRRALDRIELGGIPLEVGSLDEVSAWLADEVLRGPEGRPTIVAHVNAANCHRLSRDPALTTALEGAGHLLLDGVGMRMGACIVGLGRQPAVNGTDLFPLVMTRLEAAGARIYLLGGRDGVADLAARAIERDFPGVEVVGARHGYFTAEEASSICAGIVAADPDLVLVGLGFGLQERFALEHRSALEGPLLWMVGGLFDFVSGVTPRAPGPLRRANLEWLYRLALEPRRMLWRNAVAAPLFLLWCLRQRLGHRGPTG